MFLKVIACEIAFREICFAAARSPNVIDLEFLTQGHHDVPGAGRQEIQERINAVPAGKFDAILLGYGLCSNMLVGLRSDHTRLVIPRAHDCITFFLGSKERYQNCFAERPGTYYYTSGWLECRQRRGLREDEAGGAFLPAHTGAGAKATYEHWVKKYGEEKAQYLLEVMGRWTDNYSHGTLIDFDFTKPLALDEQVRKICAERGWQFEKIEGDLRLLQRWLDAQWDSADFLVVKPGERVVASYDEGIIAATPDHVIEPQPV
ncbi:MAG: DUF1638 domain-containing protein [Verrucomicrobia bacterium]|nr:DUF1638 domain-containing protein [Verrucomicrobiota bacterium]